MKFAGRPYPKPGKTPENTPHAPKTSREDLTKAGAVLLMETRRIEETALSLGEEVAARELRRRIRDCLWGLKGIRARREDDDRYEDFEGSRT